ncbi:hypothetical protein [Neobacillus sp. FSL H8-0543]
MKNEHDQTSEGLNQIFEIINAKGDTGELENIIKKDKTTDNENQSESVKP